jgi:hypothetical protein
MRLKAPPFFGSANIGGQVYAADDDGCVEVENAAHVEDLRSHGFTDVTEVMQAAATEAEEAAKAIDKQVKDEFSGLNRFELFAWAREHNLRMATPINLSLQRQMCRDHKAKLDKGIAPITESVTQTTMDIDADFKAATTTPTEPSVTDSSAASEGDNSTAPTGNAEESDAGGGSQAEGESPAAQPKSDAAPPPEQG